MRRIDLTAAIVFWLVVACRAPMGWAHCEIPCGIYDDELRMKLIEEHIGTIEKSMKEIVALSKTAPVNYNQLVRWIGNKEAHADEIQEIVSEYFMTQRVKPTEPGEAAYEKYARQIALLHAMLVEAMKAKQTTDTGPVERLKALVAEFRDAYFSEADEEHLEKHRH